MHINRTDPSPTEAKITIKAEASELQKAKAVALSHLSARVKVPGFREGKVPPAILEKNVDQNALQSEVIEHAVETLYASMVRQEGLRPVANPEIAIKKFVPFTDLEFEVTVTIIGRMKLGDYRKIKLARTEVKVSGDDVTEVINSLKKRAAERKEVERAAKEGDEITFDFSGTDSKGEPVQGADGKEYPLVIGSNAFIPGFEPELIGLKTGDEKSFIVTFPKDYGVKALRNKKVTFVVKVHKVSEIVEPKLDDNFAAAVGPFKTVKDLKDDIKKSLTFERGREAESQYENELLQKIADKSEVDIPKILVDEQIDRIENEERQNLAYRGQTWEEHLNEEGVTAEEHREQKRPAAEQRVKVGILLSEISDAEGIQVTPEEVEVRLQLMKGQYRDPAAVAELDKPEALRDIENRIRTEKTLEKLKTYAGA